MFTIIHFKRIVMPQCLHLSSHFPLLGEGKRTESAANVRALSRDNGIKLQILTFECHKVFYCTPVLVKKFSSRDSGIRYIQIKRGGILSSFLLGNNFKSRLPITKSWALKTKLRTYLQYRVYIKEYRSFEWLQQRILQSCKKENFRQGPEKEDQQ